MSKGRVLSIQSHVTFGYVGGKAAVFPLQCLNYDVDVVNTVQFSNHSGYGRFGGSRANAEELTRIFTYMDENGLLIADRLLTGYIPGGDALSAVANLARQLRDNNPDLVYLLDPVLGDAGKLYVSPDVIPIYRSMLPMSTIITPNWFEVEVLTDVHITDLSSLRHAFEILHRNYEVPNVVISSIPLKKWLRDALPVKAHPPADGESDYLLAIVSSTEDHNKKSALSAVHIRYIPCIPGYFSGVGDLFSALVLAHYDPIIPNPKLNGSTTSETTLSRAVTQAIRKTYGILKLTNEHALTLPEEDRQMSDDELDAQDSDRVVRRMRGRELRLIQGQDLIRGEDKEESWGMDSWTEFWEQ